MTNEPSFFSTHKLLKHLDRLHEWRETGDTRPLHIGMDLTNVCNHRCPMCNGAPGVIGPDKSSLPYDVVEQLVADFKSLGVKAISLGGGGDASCHKRLADILRLFKANGIESAIFTNAQLVRDDVLDAMVECCTWARCSLDADSPEMFKATHGMEPRDWERVLENIAELVRRRNASNRNFTIGTSFLIGPHTIKGIYGAAKIARELGVDYIRMRPFFTWEGKLPFSQEEAAVALAELHRAAELDTDRFKVSYPAARTEWVQSGIPPRQYSRCNIHHFTTQVAADQKVYLCCHTKEMDRYCLGDLTKNTFLEIWNSERRRDVYRNINYADCATPCMMSAHNDLLDLIERPVEHSNFL